MNIREDVAEIVRGKMHLSFRKKDKNQQKHRQILENTMDGANKAIRHGAKLPTT